VADQATQAHASQAVVEEPFSKYGAQVHVKKTMEKFFS